MYQPLTISNYFIQKSHETGHPVTAMKLIKLVYIAHGWYLALNRESLINEAIQAWKYGPVIHSLYQKLKRYYQHDILSIDFPTSEEIDKEDKIFLDKIWEVYGEYDGLQLSTTTHQPGTPWDTTYEKGEKFIQIPNDLIQQYYTAKMNKQNNGG